MLLLGVIALIIITFTIVFVFGIYTSCKSQVRIANNDYSNERSKDVRLSYSWKLSADEIEQIDDWDEFESKAD